MLLFQVYETPKKLNTPKSVLTDNQQQIFLNGDNTKMGACDVLRDASKASQSSVEKEKKVVLISTFGDKQMQQAPADLLNGKSIEVDLGKRPTAAKAVRAYDATILYYSKTLESLRDYLWETYQINTEVEVTMDAGKASGVRLVPQMTAQRMQTKVKEKLGDEPVEKIEQPPVVVDQKKVVPEKKVASSLSGVTPTIQLHTEVQNAITDMIVYIRSLERTSIFNWDEFKSGSGGQGGVDAIKARNLQVRERLLAAGLGLDEIEAQMTQMWKEIFKKLDPKNDFNLFRRAFFIKSDKVLEQWEREGLLSGSLTLDQRKEIKSRLDGISTKAEAERFVDELRAGGWLKDDDKAADRAKTLWWMYRPGSAFSESGTPQLLYQHLAGILRFNEIDNMLSQALMTHRSLDDVARDLYDRWVRGGIITAAGESNQTDVQFYLRQALNDPTLIDSSLNTLAALGYLDANRQTEAAAQLKSNLDELAVYVMVGLQNKGILAFDPNDPLNVQKVTDVTTRLKALLLNYDETAVLNQYDLWVRSGYLNANMAAQMVDAVKISEIQSLDRRAIGQVDIVRLKSDVLTRMAQLRSDGLLEEVAQHLYGPGGEMLDESLRRLMGLSDAQMNGWSAGDKYWALTEYMVNNLAEGENWQEKWMQFSQKYPASANMLLNQSTALQLSDGTWNAISGTVGGERPATLRTFDMFTALNFAKSSYDNDLIETQVRDVFLLTFLQDMSPIGVQDFDTKLPDRTILSVATRPSLLRNLILYTGSESDTENYLVGVRDFAINAYNTGHTFFNRYGFIESYYKRIDERLVQPVLLDAGMSNLRIGKQVEKVINPKAYIYNMIGGATAMPANNLFVNFIGDEGYNLSGMSVFGLNGTLFADNTMYLETYNETLPARAYSTRLNPAYVQNAPFAPVMSQIRVDLQTLRNQLWNIQNDLEKEYGGINASTFNRMRAGGQRLRNENLGFDLGIAAVGPGSTLAAGMSGETSERKDNADTRVVRETSRYQANAIASQFNVPELATSIYDLFFRWNRNSSQDNNLVTVGGNQAVSSPLNINDVWNLRLNSRFADANLMVLGTSLFTQTESSAVGGSQGLEGIKDLSLARTDLFVLGRYGASDAFEWQVFGHYNSQDNKDFFNYLKENLLAESKETSLDQGLVNQFFGNTINFGKGWQTRFGYGELRDKTQTGAIDPISGQWVMNTTNDIGVRNSFYAGLQVPVSGLPGVLSLGSNQMAGVTANTLFDEKYRWWGAKYGTDNVNPKIVGAGVFTIREQPALTAQDMQTPGMGGQNYIMPGGWTTTNLNYSQMPWMHILDLSMYNIVTAYDRAFFGISDSYERSVGPFTNATQTGDRFILREGGLVLTDVQRNQRGGIDWGTGVFYSGEQRNRVNPLTNREETAFGDAEQLYGLGAAYRTSDKWVMSTTALTFQQDVEEYNRTNGKKISFEKIDPNTFPASSGQEITVQGRDGGQLKSYVIKNSDGNLRLYEKGGRAALELNTSYYKNNVLGRSYERGLGSARWVINDDPKQKLAITFNGVWDPNAFNAAITDPNWMRSLFTTANDIARRYDQNANELLTNPNTQLSVLPGLRNSLMVLGNASSIFNPSLSLYGRSAQISAKIETTPLDVAYMFTRGRAGVPDIHGLMLTTNLNGFMAIDRAGLIIQKPDATSQGAVGIKVAGSGLFDSGPKKDNWTLSLFCSNINGPAVNEVQTTWENQKWGFGADYTWGSERGQGDFYRVNAFLNYKPIGSLLYQFKKVGPFEENSLTGKMKISTALEASAQVARTFMLNGPSATAGLDRGNLENINYNFKLNWHVNEGLTLYGIGRGNITSYNRSVLGVNKDNTIDNSYLGAGIEIRWK